MKLYLAPLEGITSYIYRKALYQCFDGFDKYFIPFIRAKQNLNFSGREKKDISPENNSGMYAVPQILTRNADDFLRTANQLKEYGYQEVKALSIGKICGFNAKNADCKIVFVRRPIPISIAILLALII